MLETKADYRQNLPLKSDSKDKKVTIQKDISSIGWG
jgi:hypothetical protein